MTADTESALADLRLVRSYLNATRTQVLMDDDRRVALAAIAAVKVHIEHLEANRDELRKAWDVFEKPPLPGGPSFDRTLALYRAIEKVVEG